MGRLMRADKSKIFCGTECLPACIQQGHTKGSEASILCIALHTYIYFRRLKSVTATHSESQASVKQQSASTFRIEVALRARTTEASKAGFRLENGSKTLTCLLSHSVRTSCSTGIGSWYANVYRCAASRQVLMRMLASAALTPIFVSACNMRCWTPGRPLTCNACYCTSNMAI